MICPEPLELSSMVDSGHQFLLAHQKECFPEESKVCYVSAELTDDNPFDIETELAGLFVRAELYFFKDEGMLKTRLVYKCSTPLRRCNYLFFDCINRKQLLDRMISKTYTTQWIDSIQLILDYGRLPEFQKCWVTGYDEPQLCDDDENSCAFEWLSNQRCQLGSNTLLMIETEIDTSNERSERVFFDCKHSSCNDVETLQKINTALRSSYETQGLIWPMNCTEEPASTTTKLTTSTLRSSK